MSGEVFANEETGPDVVSVAEGYSREILRSIADLYGENYVLKWRLERLLVVLEEHWLFSIECDNENGLDKPCCACAELHLGWHPSVGEAVRAWIEHVKVVARM